MIETSFSIVIPPWGLLMFIRLPTPFLGVKWSVPGNPLSTGICGEIPEENGWPVWRKWGEELHFLG
jgi:hypothetical protein